MDTKGVTRVQQHEDRLPMVAWRWVASAMAALAVVLTAVSGGYGFERDELYFRMLPPAWGYVDQPPLTPLLARVAANVSSAVWVERIPATLFAVLSVLVVALVTRELGGRAGAQGLCAWSYAFASIPLVFGHVLLTTTIDLVVWPLACLFAIRALRRAEPRWWLAFGAIVGLSTFNKLLVTLLMVALVAGLLISGPRRVLLSRWFWAAGALAVMIALPNLIYQATHSWPQVTMSRALSQNNAGTVRIVMWPYLILLLGPVLVPIWVAGLVALRRRPQWRAVRFLPTAFAVLLVETFIGGGQLYYPIGLLTVVFAAGCIPAAEFLAGSRLWRRAAWIAIAVNALVSATIALPLVPVMELADTPLPAINQTVGDQIGWPEYSAQVAAVYRSIRPSEHAVLITSNYGEAGAFTHYGPLLGLPRPYSGQNELYFDAHPPNDTTTIVIVGAQLPDIRDQFTTCLIRAHLHNNAAVDNEEAGQPIAICRGPKRPWPTLWRAFQHYD
jgi:hypothetical protein